MDLTEMIAHAMDEAYSDIYERESNGEDVPYGDALERFDLLCRAWPSLMTALYRKRHDVVSSDREAVALMRALDGLCEK